jgi:chondroitin-sulfate-ABC endolyase/exolyase
MSDYQISVNQSPVTPDFMEIRSTGDITPSTEVSNERMVATETIIKRLDAWYLSSGAFQLSPAFVLRKEAVNKQIKMGLTKNTQDLNVVRRNDGLMSGTGLFPDYMPSVIDGVSIRKFRDIMSGTMMPLAYDFRTNGTLLSSQRYINQLDWLNEQGWADGSALGGMNFEKLRSAGYFHSLFLMRNQLDTARLSRELNTLNWMSKFGKANTHFEFKGENADDLRALAVAKLVFALMQPVAGKRDAAMNALTAYFNNSFAIAPGLLETFKPDYSGFHHAASYFTQYYPEALYAAAWVYYLLHDTPYALSKQTYSNIKNCLLTYRTVCSGYDAPVSTCGRFPLGGQFLDDTMPAFAYLALANKQPDNELLAAFSRLWKPNESPLKENFSTANTGICLRTTMGETELCLKAAAHAVPAEKAQITSLFLPYTGLLIHRNATNYVATKGYSKYIWDYEASSTENLWGRYLSNGQIEYTNLTSGRKNNAYHRANWDWSRIPGTTAKYLSKEKIAFGNGVSHRNFSDRTFLGGVTLNDTISMFSVQLHDIAYDKTFTADKSVFCFGNVLLCMGSNISDSARSVRTETTLFQNDLLQGEQLLLNGKKIKKQTDNLQKAILTDNIGNCFIVTEGIVDIIQNDSMATAVINHGTAPVDKKYSYYMLLQPDKKQIVRFANAKTCPVTEERNDKTAHIAVDNSTRVRAYAIFNKDSVLNDQFIEKVNVASLIMIQPSANGSLLVALSDPDMHRPGATSLQTLKHEIEATPSRSFNYEFQLRGNYEPETPDENIKVVQKDNKTIISLKVINGATYKMKLLKLN